MKKFLLLLILSSGICSLLQAKIDLLEVNRSFLEGVGTTLCKAGNLGSTLVAIFAHNRMKSSNLANLFNLQDKHLMGCLLGGWVGDVLNNAFEKHDLPSWVRVPFQHSFAFSWLACNVIEKKGAVLQDPASWMVGGYLILNWVDRYWNSQPWPFDHVKESRRK